VNNLDPFVIDVHHAYRMGEVRAYAERSRASEWPNWRARNAFATQMRGLHPLRFVSRLVSAFGGFGGQAHAATREVLESTDTTGASLQIAGDSGR
jgi:hypothetical protein